jgi:rhodanese-related sulfurtransferase
VQFITSNILPITIALFSGTMLLWSLIGNRIRGIKEVDCIAALQLINHKSALVLDVREDKEYQDGHVLNARLIPLGKLGERIGELEKYKEQPIVVACRSGNRSAAACALLGKQGFAQAYNLAGGMLAWQKASLPVEKQSAEKSKGKR